MVNVVGKKLTDKQRKFLIFIKLLQEEDKLNLISNRFDTDMWKEILTQDYYDDIQRESILELRKRVSISFHTNPKLKQIYLDFVSKQTDTVSLVLTKTYLEEYFNK